MKQIKVVDLAGDEVRPELFRDGAQIPVEVRVMDEEIVLVYRHDLTDKQVIQWAETRAGCGD